MLPQVGVWLSAEDRGHWYDAKVIEIRPGVDGNAGNVKVHWKGFSTRLDSWVPLIPSRIRGVCTRSSISRVCKEKHQEQQTQRNSDRNEDIANKNDDNAADAAKKDVGAVDPISSALVPASTESLDPRLFEHEDAVAVWSEVVRCRQECKNYDSIVCGWRIKTVVRNHDRRCSDFYVWSPDMPHDMPLRTKRTIRSFCALNTKLLQWFTAPNVVDDRDDDTMADANDDDDAAAVEPEYVSTEYVLEIPIGASFEVWFKKHGCPYEAKVVAKRLGEVKVHYKGFKKEHDEWIGERSERLRLPKRYKKAVKPPAPPKTPSSVASPAANGAELVGAAVAGATTGEANAPRPVDGVGTDSMDDDSAPVVEARSETTTDVEAAATMLSIAPTAPSYESTARQDVGDANNNNDSPPPAYSSSPSLDDRAVHALIMQKAELVDRLAVVERKLQVVRQQNAQQTNAQTRVSHASASNDGKTTMPWKKRPSASSAGGTSSWVHGPPRYDSEIHVPFPNQKRRGTKLQRLAATS